MADGIVAPVAREKDGTKSSYVAVVAGWSTLAVAAVSGLAYSHTMSACGVAMSGMDEIRRSAYCGALNLPGAPSSASAVLLTLVLFALPTAFCVALAVAARHHASKSVLKVAAGASALLVGASLVMSAFAHVTFVGGGL